MGMFDYVKYEMKCPTCGRLLNDFQSKDGMCVMATLEITEVRNFYISCKRCRTWIVFSRKLEFAQGIDDFAMTVGKE